MQKKTIIIGVTGGSGGGKTSVSREILNHFPHSKIAMIEHIKELQAGRPVDIPIYDYTQHTRSNETYRQEPQDVFIVEGILVLEDERLRDLMDIKLFVDTDDDIRIIRRIKRDMEERGRSLDSIIEQYTSVVKPMYHQFIEPTKRYADIVIPEGVSNTVAIDLINTKIASILGEK